MKKKYHPYWSSLGEGVGCGTSTAPLNIKSGGEGDLYDDIVPKVNDHIVGDQLNIQDKLNCTGC
jgi:hypothetical protein